MIDLSTLNPVFQKKIEEWLSVLDRNNLKVLLTRGFSTPKQQDALYAQGRTVPGKVVTNARGTPPQSFHCFGVAIDFAPIINGLVLYDIPTMETCADLAKGLGMEWGGDWPSFPDYGHIQYTQGNPLSYFQKGGTLATIYPVTNPDSQGILQRVALRLKRRLGL